MAKYAFPAVFTKEDKGYFSIRFPDLDDCFTSGKGIANAIEMAGDVLCLTIYQMEEENKKIPEPSALENIKVGAHEFVQFIACDTDFYKKFYEKRAVKKTLTIPAYLNALAEEKDINFSAVLQEALKQKLGGKLT